MKTINSKPKIFIILLNWKGWKDTIECLESLLRLNYENFKVIVCDNNSQDDSVCHIKSWAEGKLNLDSKAQNRLSILTYPPINKPILYEELLENSCTEKSQGEANLILIQNKTNLGFAGGCNVGIRYALSNEADMVWLLNNDTVADPEVLNILIEQLRENDDIGFISPEIYIYRDPSTKSGTGGRFSPFEPSFTKIDKNKDCKKLYKCDHITGAAMLVRSEVIKEIGYMDEEYFMYREETDWMLRAKKLTNWKIAVAAEAKVWHKIAASSGHKPAFHEYYNTRNTLKLFKRFYPIQYFWIICIYFPYRLLGISLKKGTSKRKRINACIRGILDHLYSVKGMAEI
jgi:GT2 family glycosyltransferase